MFIQTEDTPNPATLKFIPGVDVLPGSSAEFSSTEEAKTSPLASRLLRIDGVDSVFLSGDFVSIAKLSRWNGLRLNLLY